MRPEQTDCDWDEALQRINVARVQREHTLDLSELALPSVPAELFALQEIVELKLGGNQLAALPPEIGRLTALQSLSLSGNQLAALPPEIGRLTALQSLSLYGNPLPEPIAAALERFSIECSG